MPIKSFSLLSPYKQAFGNLVDNLSALVLLEPDEEGTAITRTEGMSLPISNVRLIVSGFRWDCCQGSYYLWRYCWNRSWNNRLVKFGGAASSDQDKDPKKE